MTTFKVGDRVKYVGLSQTFNEPKFIGATGVVVVSRPNFVKVRWDEGSIDAGNGAKYADNLELITPTGFEVGKKYNVKGGIKLYECVWDDGSFALLKDEDGTPFLVHNSGFDYYGEYIPPPPEEWRAVFYVKNGKPEISTQTYKTESGCRDAYRGNRVFMHAIRTDEGVLKNG